VLVDLIGTLFTRIDKKDISQGKYQMEDFEQFMLTPGNRSDETHDYFYLFRPGYKEFLLRLHSHNGIRLAFYTSMYKKNIQTVFDILLDSDLEPLRANL